MVLDPRHRQVVLNIMAAEADGEERAMTRTILWKPDHGIGGTSTASCGCRSPSSTPCGERTRSCGCRPVPAPHGDVPQREADAATGAGGDALTWSIRSLRPGVTGRHHRRSSPNRQAGHLFTSAFARWRDPTTFVDGSRRLYQVRGLSRLPSRHGHVRFRRIAGTAVL